jgi:signal peptidase I
MAEVSDIKENNTNQEFDLKTETYDWVEAVVFSVAVIVLIFTFVFRIVGVEGTSMTNTLQDGDRVIISGIEYTPKQFDIVVLSTKAVDKPIIKRVIAVGGQTVDIDYDTNTVYVTDSSGNKTAIKEPFIKVAMNKIQGEIVNLPAKVPKGCVFVMGDNRNDSLDSRYSEIGMIDDRNILGRAVLRLFPFNSFGVLK